MGAWRQLGDAGNRGINAVEVGVLCSGGGYMRAVAVIGDLKLAGERGTGAAVLRFLLSQSFAAELDVGAAKSGIVGAFRDGEGGGGDGVGPPGGDVVIETHRRPLSGGVVVHAFGADREGGDAGVDLERRPGEEAGFDLVGEDVGIAGGGKDFLRHFSGDLVLSVAVGDAADEDGGEYKWPIESDGADDVVEDAVVAPDGHGFFQGFGETEVGDAGEVLVGWGDAVAAAGGQEFLGADQGELVAEIVGHDVLAAFAAVEREQGDAGAAAAGFVGEHAAVFVVRVGDDHHEAGAGAELAQGLLEGGGAAVDAEGLVVWRGGDGGGDGGLGGEGRGEECGGE